MIKLTFISLITFLTISCAQFTPVDKVITQIEECTQNTDIISPACAEKFKSQVFEGQFIELRSKYIGDYIGSVTVEVKTGEKSVMCKTPVTEKNLESLKSMKKGDPIKLQGTAKKSTRFKNSYHSYITLEPCSFSI